MTVTRVFDFIDFMDFTVTLLFINILELELRS